jgi:hypothetical protein
MSIRNFNLQSSQVMEVEEHCVCSVHTVVLFQSSIAVYRQTQHVKYCYEHTTSATCFGLLCSHLQVFCKRANEHWLLHLCVRDTYCLRLLLKS